MQRSSSDVSFLCRLDFGVNASRNSHLGPSSKALICCTYCDIYHKPCYQLHLHTRITDIGNPKESNDHLGIVSPLQSGRHLNIITPSCSCMPHALWGASTAPMSYGFTQLASWYIVPSPRFGLLAARVEPTVAFEVQPSA